MHDMLRIMDVASALRRERETAQSQLDVDAARARLRERLLATAAAAGEPVTAAEVDAAIAQYFATQHRYADPPPSWARFVADLWVRRVAVGVLALLAAFVFVVVWALVAQVAAPGPAPSPVPSPSPPPPRAAAPKPPVAAAPDQPPPPPAPTPKEQLAAEWERFERTARAARALAADDDARDRVGKAFAAGELAYADGDASRLHRAQRELKALVETLENAFVIEVVDRPGVKSAVQRRLDGKVSGYYVIVEATHADNRALSLQVRDAETGQTKSVSRWGEQVPEAVFRRLAADKQADGVLDERLFVRKQRGVFAEVVVMPGANGAPLPRGRQITSW
jgi:hypothetical protein